MADKRRTRIAGRVQSEGPDFKTKRLGVEDEWSARASGPCAPRQLAPFFRLLSSTAQLARSVQLQQVPPCLSFACSVVQRFEYFSDRSSFSGASKWNPSPSFGDPALTPAGVSAGPSAIRPKFSGTAAFKENHDESLQVYRFAYWIA